MMLTICTTFGVCLEILNLLVFEIYDTERFSKRLIFMVSIFIILNKIAKFCQTIRDRSLKQKPNGSQIIEVDLIRFGDCLKKHSEHDF